MAANPVRRRLLIIGLLLVIPFAALGRFGIAYAQGQKEFQRYAALEQKLSQKLGPEDRDNWLDEDPRSWLAQQGFQDATSSSAQKRGISVHRRAFKVFSGDSVQRWTLTANVSKGREKFNVRWRHELGWDWHL